MKNGSAMSRKAAKGCFGGSRKAEKVVNYTESTTNLEGDTITLKKTKKAGRLSKGSEGAKLSRRLSKGVLFR